MGLVSLVRIEPGPPLGARDSHHHCHRKSKILILEDISKDQTARGLVGLWGVCLYSDWDGELGEALQGSDGVICKIFILKLANTLNIRDFAIVFL